MIYLANGDILKVDTSTSATLNCHMSYVDIVTATGVITPGRTNVIINSAAIGQTLLAGPASGSVRNIKIINIFNEATSNIVSVHHYDGSIDVEFIEWNLSGESGLQYAEGNGWSVIGTATTGNVTIFSGTGGSWTKPTGCKFVIVELLGAGGGGGAGGSLATAAVAMGGAGGGGGAWARGVFDAADLASSTTVTCGTGGTAGARGAGGAAGGDGGIGGTTDFGGFIYAYGGGGGRGGAVTAAAGAGGGGGGTATAGLVGSTTVGTGGQPWATGNTAPAVLIPGIAGQGGSSAIAVFTALQGGAENGGAAGAGHANPQVATGIGASSLRGGGGGGMGGGHTALTANIAGGAGGKSGTYTAGGGGAVGTDSTGGAATDGSAGGAANSTRGGHGGGGGGVTSFASAAGGNGGAGGVGGGGGGGGGVGMNPGLAGNGGVGGAGYVIVYSY